MPNRTIHIEVDSIPALKELCGDLLHIMVNLRKSTVYWEKVYGAEARSAKNRWQDRADRVIRHVGIDIEDQLDGRTIFAIQLKSNEE